MKGLLSYAAVTLLLQGGQCTDVDGELTCEDDSARDAYVGLLQKSGSPSPLQPSKVAASSGWGSSHKCPGSGSWVHASCQVSVTVAAPCAEVAAEIVARAGHAGGWVDPHNGGQYSVLSHSPTEINVKRLTNAKTSYGGKVYTDKQTLTLKSSGNSACVLTGCSESQGFSVKDFSTNYCNLRNLYCGSKDGCKSVLHDFTMEETKVKPSSGAGKDAAQCITGR
eukprot:TRINITY_DN14219_c0_g1_i1.p1 TRINITY_DN14219_c0_g1~~TRINITY_DN14219_c0_g1_i1.p1  ORF type:complete len:223 (-),score=49.94 TRINITY_DN14219_c0_g1_i1:266-934(-)